MIVYCDEVGMSSIAGPLMVCAVADNGVRPIAELKDSKAYSQKRREKLYEILASSLTYACGAANVLTIEKMNIYYARFEAMRRAILLLERKGIKIDEVVVDGNAIIPNLHIRQRAIIRADEKLWCCSAASILAKVKRDRSMTALGKIFDGYGWDQNKGYMSPTHLCGVIRNGLTTLHRRGFKYTQYCEYERNQFLKSGITAEEFVEFINTPTEKTGTRYSQWLESLKTKKYGETEW